MAYISSSSVCSAVLRNDIAKLSNLIKQGKRIDIQDNLGYTPLHLAAKKLYLGCLTLLLQHPDCPINVQSFEGYTSLYLACANKSPPIQIIKSLLENGADPNIGNNEQIYPLHIACKNGNLNIIKMLLEYGADINVQDVDNDTPLHYTIDNNQKLAVQYLLKCEANTSLTNLYGLNPLMLSVARQNEDIFNMLLPLTADLNQQGAEKETTLSLAIRVGNYNMVQNIFNQDTDLIINSLDYALGLEELYELDKLKIFKFIWSKVNHKLLFQNLRFIFVLKKVLTVMKNFEQLAIIFQTADLNLEMGNIGYIFENMFSVEEYPDKEYFVDKMDKLICITKGIFKQDGLICKDGFKTLCKFIKNCPYREVLISTILTEANFIITDDCVLYAFSVNWELGSLCLQYSYFLNPSEFFKLLTSSRDSMECLKYFMQFHTPGLMTTKETLQVTNSADIKSLLEMFSGKVKSLTELSRDVVRVCVGRSLAQNTLLVNMVDFHQTIKKLDCPLDVQLFLLLKKPVNKLPT